MRLRAVTANLGCGGPHPAERPTAAAHWVEVAAADGLDLLFLQDVPLPALDLLSDAYVVVCPAASVPSYRCKSVVAARRDRRIEIKPFALPTGKYHGSYVTAATITVASSTLFIGVSVHASPKRPTDAERDEWKVSPPKPRASGAAGELWDADFVLATLSQLVAAGQPVLAAGDYNEARGWHAADGKRWGHEYFERAAAAELLDVTFPLWDESERPTHSELQVDHIFATELIRAAITEAAVEQPMPPGLDHHPIHFTIAVDADHDESTRPK